MSRAKPRKAPTSSPSPFLGINSVVLGKPDPTKSLLSLHQVSSSVQSRLRHRKLSPSGRAHPLWVRTCFGRGAGVSIAFEAIRPRRRCHLLGLRLLSQILLVSTESCKRQYAGYKEGKGRKGKTHEHGGLTEQVFGLHAADYWEREKCCVRLQSVKMDRAGE